jgi:endonuclease YncB( thermonuclease family)
VAYATNLEKNYGAVEVSRIISVYDGDTFTCDIDNYPEIIGKKIPVRIFGIDTPEMKDKNIKVKVLAEKAKAFTKNKLITAKKVELRNMRRDKYFRILADVFVDDENIGDLLIKEELARPYFGKIKIQWRDIKDK